MFMFLYNYNLYFVPSFTGNSLLNCGNESIPCAKPNPNAGKSQINMSIHIELEHKIFLSEDMPSPNPEQYYSGVALQIASPTPLGCLVSH